MITVQQISKEITMEQIIKTIREDLKTPKHVRLVLFDKDMVIHVAEFCPETAILKSGRLNTLLTEQIKHDLSDATRFTLEEID